MESKFTGDLEEFKRRFIKETSNDLTVVLPVSETMEFWSFPKKDIPELAKRYVDALEVEQTSRWCSCLWRVHPDDVNNPEGIRRKVRIEENEECTLHTKVGMILGFFAWAYGGEESLRITPREVPPI